jgi:hypothetical protein
LEWAIATLSLCDLKIDPSDILTVIMSIGGNYIFCTLDGLFDLSKSTGIAVIESSFLNHIDTWNSVQQFESFPTFRPMANSHFLSIERDGSIPRHPNTLVGCLHRYAKGKGYSLYFEQRPNVATSQFGPVHAVIIRAILIA